MIVKTIIAGEAPMHSASGITYENRNTYYEMFGFDILIDADLKPWLIEVNVCPSMNMDSPLDRKIKTSLICDILNLIGFIPYNKRKLVKEQQRQKVEGKTKRPSRIKEDLANLSSENCLDKLRSEDWNILFELDEEYHRRGHFLRIFPNKNNVEKYSKFF